jgi:glycosyltransferase involved in cell wall biosynthesis
VKTLLIIQPYLTRYRAPFFHQLEPLLESRGVRLLVGVGRARSGRRDSVDDPEALVDLHDGLGRVTGDRIRWRRLRGLESRPDYVISEFAIRNLETYGLLARTSGRTKVGLWGHGSSHGMARSWLLRRADWFFAYTQVDREAVVDAGFDDSRVTTVGNTIDTEVLRRDLARASAESIGRFRDAYGLAGGHTALFLGGVDARKDPGFLLAVASAAQQADPEFRLVVGGDGADAWRVRRAAEQGLPVVPLGRLDGFQKALALACADVLVVPTGVGLVAVDALAAGRPIISRRDRGHGPETSYLKPGENVLWLASDIPAVQFAREVVELLRDRARLEAMQSATVLDHEFHTVAAMAKRFAHGVWRWVDE